MAKSNLTSKVNKAIFQVNFEPDIEFYDRMRSVPSIIKYFKDWETDSLSIIFKDYQLNHSLSFKFDGIIFETDSFKKDQILKVIDLIVKEAQPNLFTKKKIIRIGYRCLSLIDVSPMNFSDLVKILNLKIFNNELFENIMEPNDTTATFVFGLSDKIDCRETLGPMKKNEVPNYIQLNAKHHFYKSDGSRLLEIHKVIDSYPQVSLYNDADYFTTKLSSIKDFLDQVLEMHDEHENKLKNYLFKKSI